MTVYWFPNAAADGYREMDVPEVVTLDVFCRPCGTDNPPRLARFVRPADGGPVGVTPFIAEGRRQGPAFWMRDGVSRWRLVCPHGHDTNVRDEQVSAALDTGIPRVSL